MLVFGTNRFPAFWLTDSGYTVDFSVTTPEEIAEVMHAADAARAVRAGSWSRTRCPRRAQLDPALHDRLLAEALDAADAASVRGKDITPFLLDYIHEHTDRDEREPSTSRSSVATAGSAPTIARAWSAVRSR